MSTLKRLNGNERKLEQMSTTLETRHYELDSFNHINNANYLRYCEQARIKLFEELGYDINELKKEGLVLVTSITDSHFKIPLQHSQQMEVVTSLKEISRLKGILHHNIIQKESGASAFMCDMHWAIIPAKGKRNSPGIAQFAATMNEVPKTETKFKTFTWPKSHQNEVSSVYIQVQPYELDSFNHVNNAVYANYLESGRWHSMKQSTQFDQIQAAASRNVNMDEVGLILSRQTIKYRRAAVNFQLLRVDTSFLEIKGVRIIYYQEIVDQISGELITQGRAEIVSYNLKTGRPIKLPSLA